MTVKCLVVGHGPSYINYDYIKNFDGTILSVDRSAKDLIANGIIPDYQLFSETHENIIKFVIKDIPDSFDNINIRNKMTVIHRTSAEAMYKRVSRMKLKSILFDTDPYGNAGSINNVGLYSIVYANDILKADEIHLIGLEMGGTDEYPERIYHGWIESCIVYLRQRKHKAEIIDHSGGRFPKP